MNYLIQFLQMQRMKEADEVSEKVSSSASILKRNPKERR
jgi:hypothetical protein